MVMVMSLDDYIKKYGEVSGTKRYLGVQKLLKSRSATYASQPFVRFTREWFIWRYPEDGEDRFQEHVNKSRQSEENMIKRHGTELGKKKWQETVAKKNTVAIKRAKEGDDAVKDWYKRSGQTHKNTLENMTDDERAKWRSSQAEKRKQTVLERYGNKSKLEIYIQKYGEEGPQYYAEYLQTIFKAIGFSSEAETIIKSIIHDNPWLKDYTLYYRDSEDKSKKEWFIADRLGVRFYDFCVKEAKVILEYDGAKWHPTQEQVNEFGDELMEVTKISYKEKYAIDAAKRAKAQEKGFTVYTIRSDYTQTQVKVIIEQFIDQVRKNGRIE